MVNWNLLGLGEHRDLGDPLLEADISGRMWRYHVGGWGILFARLVNLRLRFTVIVDAAMGKSQPEEC